MSAQAAVVRTLYAAFAARDRDALTRLIAEDAAWIVPGGSPIAGTYRGHEAILAYFAELARLSAGTFRAELVDVLAGSGREVAALARATGSRDGRSYEGRYLLLCDVSDGRVTRAVLFNEDPVAFDAFWL
jgi:uncharacterized protein